ncbi:MAG: ABC transporter permease [Oscillospiraceae bacterium]|nr:ABC transporter permease [Oscillospiraceae bacterium]
MSVFKQLKIIFGNLKNDKLNTVIMILFVGASVFLMNISLSLFMHREYINNLVRDSGFYEDYMYISEPDKGDWENGGEFRNRIWEYEMSELDRLKSEGIIEGWYQAIEVNAPLSHDIENDRAPHIYYPSGLAASLRFHVSKGIWFDKYDFEGNSDENVIPVVVGSDLADRFKVGENISLYNPKHTEKNYLVIGVLERNAYIFTTGSSGTDMDTNYLFEQKNDAIIIIEDNINEIMPFLHGTAVIKASRENQQTVFDALGDYSRIFTFKYMSDNAYERNRTTTEMLTVIFVLMAIVCIAGVSSGNLLSTITSKKKYAVYFLCGMDCKTGVVTTFLESVLKLAVPGAVGYALFIHWREEQLYNGLRVTSANAAVTAAFLAAIFLLTSLMPLLDIKRTSPVKIIVDT